MSKPCIRADVRKSIQSGDFPWLRANLRKLNCRTPSGPHSGCTTKRNFRIMDEYTGSILPLAKSAKLEIRLKEKEIWFKSNIWSDQWYTVLILDKNVDGNPEPEKDEVFFCHGQACRAVSPLHPEGHEDDGPMRSLLAAADKAYKSVLKAVGLMDE